MSSNSRGSENKGSENTSRQSQRNPDGSYAPAWEKKSLDIVPPNDQALPDNPVAEAIMGADSPSGQTPEQPQQNSPTQPSSDESPAES